MWQLELLSQVLPAFAALAQDFKSSSEELQRDAELCWSDIVNIGLAVSESRGEWASQMDNEVITGLLKALDSRLPKKKSWLERITPKGKSVTALMESFPGLDRLTCSISPNGIANLDECSQLQVQTDIQYRRYLEAFSPKVKLFHTDEITDKGKRQRFLRRVQRARTHLMEVYYKDSSSEAENLSLSRHPSHGMKKFANIVYDLLEKHWRCNCPQRAAKPFGAREARLSLVRHRHLAPKVPANTAQYHPETKFEVLLPVCQERVEWKVTNVEVKIPPSREATSRGELVNEDICDKLSRSGHFLKIDFLASNNQLWHLKPTIVHGSSNNHTAMDSLYQLLGDNKISSPVSKSKPQDQLKLCYILANSMLYLYPGSWFHPGWSSNEVSFIRDSKDSISPLLTFPYLSVKLQPFQNEKTVSSLHWQVHPHPAILALGIIFLEIATGVRFQRVHEQEALRQYNRDNHKALELFSDLEKQGLHDLTKRMPSGLREAIRSCLELRPSADIPVNQLSEEGPIRHYILSCIVRPLASDLKSYKVSLEELRDYLIPEIDKGSLDGLSGQTEVRRQASSVAESSADSDFSVLPQNRDLCLFTRREEGPAEEPVEEIKKASADSWLKWHDATMAPVKVRVPGYSASPSNERLGDTFSNNESGNQFNAPGGTNNNNTSSGNQFSGAVFNGPVCFKQ